MITRDSKHLDLYAISVVNVRSADSTPCRSQLYSTPTNSVSCTKQFSSCAPEVGGLVFVWTLIHRIGLLWTSGEQRNQQKLATLFDYNFRVSGFRFSFISHVRAFLAKDHKTSVCCNSKIHSQTPEHITTLKPEQPLNKSTKDNTN